MGSRELFYRDLSGRVLSVPVQTDPTFEPGNAVVLFDGQYFVGKSQSYDILPDGQRFLMLKSEATTNDGSAPAQIIVVENWFDELQRLVPVD